jgi:hypothetical protein
MANKDKSRHKLEDVINKEVTKMFESILDYTQVACPNNETFKVLRSRILRSGNDCIRRLCSSLDSYNVEYKVKNEDFIEVIRKR